MKKTIYYVTGNQGKFEEVKYFVENNTQDIELVQFNAQIPEIQTLDQKAIAVDKALKAWEILQKPLIIDDSAIYFEKYNKFPGTLSKYIYQGLGFEGIKKLIENGDKATFFLYMIYVKNIDSFSIFEGKCKGTLTKPTSFSGNVTLPFDCFFIPRGTTKTYAQMRGTTEGNNYFYRIKALKKFLI
jgi:non-canonical purine NTP pyrophosphatase (RdgB/HAM1 family)